MASYLSHVTFFPRIPQILIAENNFSTFESLVGTFQKSRLDIDFDVLALFLPIHRRWL
jgi:hypothetical protein